MKRDLMKRLCAWKKDQDRLPLLLRGARQVGKTYLVREFGKSQFEHFIEINFESNPSAAEYFQTPDPIQIVNALRLILKTPIVAGKTLLFFDEIQLCPQAIVALRYFYEEMPDLHVIGAGSLLEFTLNDAQFQMPVGRVQYLFMKPLSFGEYLSAMEFSDLRSELKQMSLKRPIAQPVHSKLLELTRQYCLLGGMPKPIHAYIQTKDLSRVQDKQTSILTTYRDDFGKYAKRFPHHYLQTLFQRAPRLIGREFVYREVDPQLRAREIKRALSMLGQAGVLHTSHSVSCSGIPLSALVKEKKFKIFFVDIGLIMRSLGLSQQMLFEQDLISINRGVLAEQFVAQELLASYPPTKIPELFWWHRQEKASTAEVDFVTCFEDQMIPIEVKAGATGRLRSLKIFMEEKKSPLGIRICSEPLSFDRGVLTIPFYLVSQLDRLVQTLNDLL